jgi:hypothetical protein
MGFEEVKLGRLGQIGMVLVDGDQQIPSQISSVRALLDQAEFFWPSHSLEQLVRLPGKELAEHRTG